MTLSIFAAQTKRALFDDLLRGQDPHIGEFDAQHLKTCRNMGQPNMGKTTFKPSAIVFEFIFAGNGDASSVFSVTVASPQRIVFLPVPEWVVENIWQGSVDGSYHFEADAMAHLERLREQCAPDANAPLFGPQPAKRRE